MRAIINPYETNAYLPTHAFVIDGDVDPEISVDELYARTVQDRSMSMGLTLQMYNYSGNTSRGFKIDAFLAGPQKPKGIVLNDRITPVTVTSASSRTELDLTAYLLDSTHQRTIYFDKDADYPTIDSSYFEIGRAEYPSLVRGIVLGTASTTTTIYMRGYDESGAMVQERATTGEFNRPVKTISFIVAKSVVSITARPLGVSPLLGTADTLYDPMPKFSLVFLRLDSDFQIMASNGAANIQVIPCTNTDEAGRMFIPSAITYTDIHRYFPPLKCIWSPYTDGVKA